MPDEKRISELFQKAIKDHRSSLSPDAEEVPLEDALSEVDAKLRKACGEDPKVMLSLFISLALQTTSDFNEFFFRQGYLAGLDDGKAGMS